MDRSASAVHGCQTLDEVIMGAHTAEERQRGLIGAEGKELGAVVAFQPVPLAAVGSDRAVEAVQNESRVTD